MLGAEPVFYSFVVPSDVHFHPVLVVLCGMSVESDEVVLRSASVDGYSVVMSVARQ